MTSDTVVPLGIAPLRAAWLALASAIAGAAAWRLLPDLPVAQIHALGARLIGNGYAPGSQEFTSSGTFIVPAKVTVITVEVIGGGGASGQGSGDPHYYPGGGGGGGGYSKGTLAVTPGQSLSVTIGTGGATGEAPYGGGITSISSISASGGANGGPHTFGGEFYGGGGGTGSGGNLLNYAGGAGAGGTGGHGVTRGGGGAAGPSGNGSSAALNDNVGGASGGSPAGAGGTDSVGNNYGGGGSGWYNNPGAPGAPGWAKIAW